jgi:dihydrofolate reductase
MRRVVVFNNVSLDGYFVDASGDMSWAHKTDPEWTAFVGENARSSGGELLFGRITYELMASYWPTAAALEADPVVAEGMNRLPKVVFSRTLDQVSWSNTRLVKGELVEEVRKMKRAPGSNLVILGSGSIVSQLAQAGLVDEFQLAVHPLVLGKGRTLFEGLTERFALKLKTTRAFKNGNVLLCYESLGAR